MPLTAYREYYDYKVEDIPRLGEVVLPQREYLEDALGGEDDDEAHVEVLKGKVPQVRLGRRGIIQYRPQGQVEKEDG